MIHILSRNASYDLLHGTLVFGMGINRLANFGVSFSTLVYIDAIGLFVVGVFLSHRRRKDLTGRSPY